MFNLLLLLLGRILQNSNTRYSSNKKWQKSRSYTILRWWYPTNLFCYISISSIIIREYHWERYLEDSCQKKNNWKRFESFLLTHSFRLILEYSLRYSSTPSCQTNVTNETSLVNESREAFTATYLLRRLNSKSYNARPSLIVLLLDWIWNVFHGYISFQPYVQCNMFEVCIHEVWIDFLSTKHFARLIFCSLCINQPFV